MKQTITSATVSALIFIVTAAGSLFGGEGDALHLTLRHRVEQEPGSGRYVPVEASEDWNPNETAVIVCDMWDAHHCLNAVRRAEEMAPRMNRVLAEARDRGTLIVHAPSSCMDFYAAHPARRRAQQAATAANLPVDIGSWCHWKDTREEEIGYPIDHSDGGEDDEPEEHKQWHAKLKGMGRNPNSPWIRQTETLEIDPDRDAISDSGVEIWNLLEERGIQNVMLVGVHTNMCVLGRPFGLRQMAKNGKNVVLVRDMTDTMYNPAQRPYVSHFRGTDLVVEHVEKLVCPTVTSDQIIGGEPFRFKHDKRANILVAISEPEYRTHETLPRFADAQWRHKYGHHVVLREGDPSKHQIPGFSVAVKDADVVVVSIRRQALPREDVAALQSHLQAGKPLIGIRTSNHAFDARGGGPAGHAEWREFDHDVLGGNYTGHHGNGPLTTVSIAADSSHLILDGIEGNFTSKGSLYKVSPLASSTEALLVGRIPGQPAEPVAWTNTFSAIGARVFYTSLGHVEDFDNPQFRQLLDNALRWALSDDVAR